jgi:hypothetical protein
LENKNASVFNNNIQSENLIPPDAASKPLANTKYGGQNFVGPTQPPSRQQLTTNIPSKSSPPGMGLGDSEAMRSFGSQSYNRNNQQPSQTKGYKLNLNGKSSTTKDNRQLIMSHQDHDMAKLKTSNSNNDDAASVLTHHHQLQTSAQGPGPSHTNNLSDTPKQ